MKPENINAGNISVWERVTCSSVLNTTTSSKLSAMMDMMGKRERSPSLPTSIRPVKSAGRTRSYSLDTTGGQVQARSHLLKSRLDSKKLNEENEEDNNVRLEREAEGKRLREEEERVWNPIRRASAIRHSVYLSNAAVEASHPRVGLGMTSPQSVSKSGIFYPFDDEEEEEEDTVTAEMLEKARIAVLIKQGHKPASSKSRFSPIKRNGPDEARKANFPARGPSLKKWWEDMFADNVSVNDVRTNSAKSMEVTFNVADLVSGDQEEDKSAKEENDTIDVFETKEYGTGWEKNGDGEWGKKKIIRRPSVISSAIFWGSAVLDEALPKGSGPHKKVVVKGMTEVVPGHFLVSV